MAAQDTRAPAPRTRWQPTPPDHQLPPSPDGMRGIGQMLRSLADDTRTLLRQEIELAKLELARTARSLAKESAWIGAGVAIAAVGGLVLVVGLALLLGALLDSYWLGTLIVGGALVLTGGGFAWKGLRGLRDTELAPTGTAETLREDAEWARGEAQEFKQRLS